jgi:plasmid stabilization system protein ParE
MSFASLDRQVATFGKQLISEVSLSGDEAAHVASTIALGRRDAGGRAGSCGSSRLVLSAGRVLGREFLRAVDHCIAAIRRRPQAYQVVVRRTRRALLRRFPYGVFFEVLGGEIVVYAVFHGARDPRAWERRTNA